MARSETRRIGHVRAAMMVVGVTFALVACGQVTGLSDDYTFDDDGGGGRTDGGGTSSGADGTANDANVGTDGSRDATSDAPSEGGQSCSPSEVTAASSVMSSMTGSAACKSCLASHCCNAVQTCNVSVTSCRPALVCDLDCTTKGNPKQCIAQCAMRGSEQLTPGMAACAKSSCSAECGF